MPKVKTNKAAAKRFKVSPSGKIKRGQAYKSHILTKKTTKQKRRLGKKAIVKAEDMKNVRFMIPHAL